MDEHILARLHIQVLEHAFEGVVFEQLDLYVELPAEVLQRLRQLETGLGRLCEKEDFVGISELVKRVHRQFLLQDRAVWQTALKSYVKGSSGEWSYLVEHFQAV